MTKKLNQKGFAAIEAVLILAIVAIVGGTGYYIYQANNKATDTQNSAQTNANTATPHKKSDTKATYLTIKEWNVRAPISSSIAPQYAVVTSGQQTFARLSSDQLIAADPECTVANSAGGIINRAKSTDPFFNDAGDDMGVTVQQAIDKGTLKGSKKVGAYLYWYESGQAACGSAAKTTQDLQTKTDAAFKTAVGKFEATK
jgi:uncharacterized protein (UPF0333 family)